MASSLILINNETTTTKQNDSINDSNTKTQKTNINSRISSANSITSHSTPQATQITTTNFYQSNQQQQQQQQVVTIKTKSKLEPQIFQSNEQENHAQQQQQQQQQQHQQQIYVSTSSLVINPSNEQSNKIRIKYNLKSDSIPIESNKNTLNNNDNDSDTLSSSLSTLSSPSSSPINRSPPNSNSPQLTSQMSIHYPIVSNLTEENVKQISNVLESISEIPPKQTSSNSSTTNELNYTSLLHSRLLKSPQTIQSISTRSNLIENGSIKSANKTKKKVSFNDSLVQVHFIPNLSSFINVEKYSSSLSSSSTSSNDNEAFNNQTSSTQQTKITNSSTKLNEFFFSDEAHSIESIKTSNKSLNNKSSQEAISNDLKRNIKSYNYNQANNPNLQVVKLTVHSAKFNNDTQITNPNNFLTIIGNNNLMSTKPKRDSSATSSNRNFHSQMFNTNLAACVKTDQQTTENGLDEQQKFLNSQLNFFYSKPPRYFSSSTNTKLKSKLDKSEQYLTKFNSDDAQSQLNFNPVPQLRYISNIKKLKSSNLLMQRENSIINNQSCSSSPTQLNNSDNTNQSQTNQNENMRTNVSSPSFSKKQLLFLKQDENLVKEPSFIKNNQNHLITLNGANSTNSTNTSPLSFNSDTHLRIGSGSNKNLVLSSVNQLIALKDVNYYLSNSSVKKTNSNKHNNQQNGVMNEISKIKLKTNTTNLDTDFRRTHSALPILRNSVKLNPNSILTESNSNNKLNKPNSVNNNSNNSNNSIPVSSINSYSYKVLNSPMLNHMTRQKTILLNSQVSNLEKRARGGSIDKTSF